MSIEIAATACIYIELTLKEQSKKRRWWQTKLFTGHPTNVDNTLVHNLRAQEINCQFQNFLEYHPVTSTTL